MDALEEAISTLSSEERDELARLVQASHHLERDQPLDAVMLVHDFTSPILGRVPPTPVDADKTELTAPLQIAGDRLELPPPGELKVPLEEALVTRHSNRGPSTGNVQVHDLSTMLFHAASARAPLRSYGRNDLIFRRAASGGGIESVELLVVARNVVGLDRGVYVYNAREHCLHTTQIQEPVTAIGRAFGQEVWPLEASAMLLFVGRLQRVRWKYDALSIRVMNQDVGNLQANLMLTACAIGLSVCVNSGVKSDSIVADFGLRPGKDLVLSSLIIERPEV